MFDIFGHSQPTKTQIRHSLSEHGIEAVEFDDWPGFENIDLAERDIFADTLTEKRKYFAGRTSEQWEEEVQEESFWRKSKPEAEALVITLFERSGKYFMRSEESQSSPAWFISNTSLINSICDDPSLITWQPEAFLQFAGTLSSTGDAKSADKAFQTLLWSFAQTGIQILDEATISRVIGGVVDEMMVEFNEQKELYGKLLSKKYGASAEEVLRRVSLSNKEIAVIQLSNEMLYESNKKRLAAEESAKQATAEAKEAKKNLKKFEGVQRTEYGRKAKSARNRRTRQKSNKKKK